MKKKLLTLLATGLFMFSLVGPGLAAQVVYDDFNDAILDSAWAVNLDHATGWTYEETGSSLSVTEIEPETIDHGNGALWANIILSQSFTSLDDFHADFDFSWDSGGSDSAMQRIYVKLYNDNVLMICTGYADAWVANNGKKNAFIGSDSIPSDTHDLNLSGSASIDIDRTGDNISIKWDETELLSSVSADPINKVEIEFSYYAYDAGASSFFGSEGIDLIKISGTPAVPIPGAFWLFGSGLAVLAGIKRGRK